MKSSALQIRTDFLFVVFCASNVSTLLDANKCRHFGAYLGFGEKVKNLVFKKSTNNSINPPKADKCE